MIENSKFVRASEMLPKSSVSYPTRRISRSFLAGARNDKPGDRPPTGFLGCDKDLVQSARFIAFYATMPQERESDGKAGPALHLAAQPRKRDKSRTLNLTTPHTQSGIGAASIPAPTSGGRFDDGR